MMNTKLRRIAAFWAAPVLLGIVAGAIGSRYLPESVEAQAARQAAAVPPVRFYRGERQPPGRHRRLSTGTGLGDRECPLRDVSLHGHGIAPAAADRQ